MPNVTRTPHPKPLILVATTEAWQRQELASALTEGGFRVSTAQDERETVTLRAAYSAALASQKVEPRALLERARYALGSP